MLFSNHYYFRKIGMFLPELSYFLSIHNSSRQPYNIKQIYHLSQRYLIVETHFHYELK